jgi:1-acyl-sn-glycerol-3-phosphate acyltransferase
MSWFLPKVHCIKVDRENFSMNSFHEVRDRLMQKQAIMIFPEGKINHDSSSFLAFKSGAVLMAHAGAARIIPVYIAKREKWYRRANVVIGEAIDVRAELGERASMEDLSRLNDMLAEKEAALKTYYESKKTKKIKKEEKV